MHEKKNHMISTPRYQDITFYILHPIRDIIQLLGSTLRAMT